jgi:hypothetical protein
MTLRRCVVTLATDDRQYRASLDRLEASLAGVGFSDDVVSWRGGQLPKGSPAHADVPFAFKPFGLAEAARDRGGLLLWLDASCVAVRSLDPVFERIGREGYVLFRNWRYRVGEWASDLALETFGLPRDEAIEMPEVNAAVIGLNVASAIGASFLEQWLAAAVDGAAFRGVRGPISGEDDYRAVKWNRDGRVSSDPRVRGHRHDQTVAGILASRLGLSLTRHGLENYSARRRTIGRRTRIVIDRDVGAAGGQALASLERIHAAVRLGALAPRLPSLPRGRR